MFNLFVKQLFRTKSRFFNSVQNASIARKSLHTSTSVNIFFEPDEKAGYNKNRKLPSRIELIREGFKELKTEIALWTSEVKERLEIDPVLEFRPGETDVAWRFKDEESLKNWIITSDSDNNEGFSNSSLTINKYGKGVFSGELSTRVPKDGKIKRAGYCNMTTLRARKSFKRESYYNWSNYNTLVMKVKGDGRSYFLNIHTKGYYDIMWFDMFHYVLFTRGGPYWQVTKIPFSKFFLSSKGRIQDKQFPVPLDRITSFGITASDKIDGEFKLEIDYIGLEYDPSHIENFAYEMYEQDQKYIVAT
ncbi:complex I intermediate-associated protein 30, mitochondrial [Agrilus planipennis]|uniref:Complex I intermediate-associated protein 30, mitochondrial n=1 Tax=Agrilus planipennis TaxID=224129 RepID=A0A1W4X369_AGRPL|nr:complex I intermediate-associated protein 30, mitochondrial [Agrilus planipennis]